ARRERAHVHAAQGAPVQVGAFRRGRVVPPRVAALAGREPAVRGGLSGGGDLPLQLGGQAAAAPPAVRLRLVPADVGGGRVRRQGDAAVEVAPDPAVAVAAPVDRVLRLLAFEPGPAGVAPQLAAEVAAVLGEGGEFGLGHGGAGDGEGLHAALVRPLLV